MKTTYIKLYAGLGNQIFQYFYGLYLQRNGKKVYYILNKTYGKNVECFDIPEVFNLYDINEKPAENIFAPEKYFTNLRIAAAKIFAKYIMQSYQTGFYQKADYIEKAIDSKSIYNFISFKNGEKYTETDSFKKISQCRNSVSIHIRGGDYLGKGSPFSGICTEQYYKKAIQYLCENTENPHFFVFTNDKTFCLTLFTPLGIEPENYTIIEDEPKYKNDPGFDLFLMSKCSHNIIANSTYSWWGAYFNEN